MTWYLTTQSDKRLCLNELSGPWIKWPGFCRHFEMHWCLQYHIWLALRWRHNGCDSVSNHQPRECLLRRLIRRTSKKTSKLRVTGLCAGNSPGTGEFPAQMASNAENVSIWWRHHGYWCLKIIVFWLKFHWSLFVSKLAFAMLILVQAMAWCQTPRNLSVLGPRPMKKWEDQWKIWEDQ